MARKLQGRDPKGLVEDMLGFIEVRVSRVVCSCSPAKEQHRCLWGQLRVAVPGGGCVRPERNKTLTSCSQVRVSDGPYLTH